jgi:hypothetical protein
VAWPRNGTLFVVIPTAILAGLLLGVWIRWWAVLVVGVGWAIVIGNLDPTAALGAGLLGAVNAVVGVLVALGLRRLLIRRGAGNKPS